MARAIRIAVDRGAGIICIALGGFGVHFTIAEAVGFATSRGVLIVAAVGNPPVHVIDSPANIPEVVAVAGYDRDQQTVTPTLIKAIGGEIDIAAPARHRDRRRHRRPHPFRPPTVQRRGPAASSAVDRQRHRPTRARMDLRSRWCQPHRRADDRAGRPFRSAGRVPHSRCVRPGGSRVRHEGGVLPDRRRSHPARCNPRPTRLPTMNHETSQPRSDGGITRSPTEADALGRFAVDDLPTGWLRVCAAPDRPDAARACTEWFGT